MQWPIRLFYSQAAKNVAFGCVKSGAECDDVDRFWAELTTAWHRKRVETKAPALVTFVQTSSVPFLAHQMQPKSATKIDPVGGPVEAWSRVAFQSRRGGSILCADARTAFERWCRKSGKTPCSANAFGRQMTALGFKRKRKGGHFHYAGITLTPVGLVAVA